MTDDGGMTSAAAAAVEIPFWFHDRPKWVSGIGRTTTCQDILNSLVRAHVDKRSKSADRCGEANIRQTSQQLVLVEQWRGVERPLSGPSKILKLWNAWGEEREQVRFVVKRISTSSSMATTSLTSLPTVTSARPRRGRRRNSSRLDTMHPRALKSTEDLRRMPRTAEIERLMRIILTQGETIHTQLRKLQQREMEIDGIEQEVHHSRTKTAGKDYLLNAYLKDHKNKAGGKRTAANSDSSSASVPECLSEMVDALNQVLGINEQIAVAEERASDLHDKIRSSSASSSSSSMSSNQELHVQDELARLKTSYDRCGREVDRNRALISSMRSAFDERRAMVSRLEWDVNLVETEGTKLEMELERVIRQRQFELDEEDDDDLEQELLNEIILGPRKPPRQLQQTYQLSNSALYEDARPPPMPSKGGERERQLLAQLQELKLSRNDVVRSNVTGSPGSNSSSGNSSGSGGSSGGGRDLKTPELPPLPHDNNGEELELAVGRRQKKLPSSSSTQMTYTKSILKAVDCGNGADLDSNSDTGLSSLHSSSDEGTYVLDTLV